MGPILPGAWQAVAISAAFIVGGCQLMATAQTSEYWWLGYVFLLLGLGLFLVAMLWVRGRLKRRREALRILDQLVGLGDRAIQVREGREAAVDQWRATIGAMMTTPPFRPQLQHTVLGGQGHDWITEPLARLRQMALRFEDDWLD